ncbi:MAG: ATP-dependent sacrificial sulfur transferase LarE [Planctomycetota bacterium]
MISPRSTETPPVPDVGPGTIPGTTPGFAPGTLPGQDDPRLQRLLDVFTQRYARRPVLTAFSGGVDSTLVAAAARLALGRDHAPAAVGDSLSLPRRELDEARAIAQQLDLKLIEVQPGEQADPDYQKNTGDRCYFCKTHLYDTLQATARRLGIAYLANGTNLDDLGDHRPGLRAADEAQVIAPLVDAQLNKQDVRDLADLLRLPNADKPAAACLASRLPFGTPVTADRLRQVEAAEDALYRLGFTGFRVRHHEEVARVELPLDQLPHLSTPAVRERVVADLKDAGYTYVTLDLEGFRSGSGNVMLTVGRSSTAP